MSYLAAGGQENDLKELGGWWSYQMVSRYARGNAGERAVKAHKSISHGDRPNRIRDRLKSRPDPITMAIAVGPSYGRAGGLVHR